MDASRGALVALRIFIGSQVAGLAAPVLQHPDGFGLTFADLVLPGFLFFMGMAVPVSMSALLRPPATPVPAATPHRRPHLLRIARRAALLYAIGMFLNAYPFLPEVLEHWRFVGVMQRLAFAYLAVSLLYVTCAPSLLPPGGPASATKATTTPLGARPRPVRFPARAMLLGGFPLLCLALWTIATYTFHNPWPECAGVPPLTRDCSLQAYIDTTWWGTEHNFDGGKFDPEGVMSTLVAVVNCWAGLAVGLDVIHNRQCYRTIDGVRRRASLLITVGALCAGGGLVLGQVIPIGKQLWTPSFALVTIGIMTAGFGLFLLALDGRRRPTPSGPPHPSTSPPTGTSTAARNRLAPVSDTLVALGRNPLLFYVLSELVITTLDYIPVRHAGPDTTLWTMGPEAALAAGLPAALTSILWALLWLTLFYVPIARLLTSRGWYLRV
ncbi:hypothetical protein ACGFXC_37170 [Streptomyces sp. NPDC048507]|uniref:hypothetical protein n=1 Tax=Streptomyces sp. NPDC048507 TaxID=3365560 RepID=UPI003713E2F2